jgi:hypothetical protein
MKSKKGNLNRKEHEALSQYIKRFGEPPQLKSNPISKGSPIPRFMDTGPDGMIMIGRTRDRTYRMDLGSAEDLFPCIKNIKFPKAKKKRSR